MVLLTGRSHCDYYSIPSPLSPVRRRYSRKTNDSTTRMRSNGSLDNEHPNRYMVVCLPNVLEDETL